MVMFCPFNLELDFHRKHFRTIRVLLVFSVTQVEIDQNQNQNLSIDKVQNLGNKRR